VLKTQLRSKLSQLNPNWQDSEDILTGDFFGALDYLPRQPYLRDFLESVERLNERVGRFELERVDWEEVEMLFWPRCPGHDDSTEPDVVLVSNQWVIVVEVKLASGLGQSQPWREYRFGQQIAENRGLPRDAVHYMIVSRARLNGAQVFGELAAHQRVELEPRTLWFRWSEAVAIVDEWLRDGAGERHAAKNEARMLNDLYGALRRRRTLSFCGFSFPHQRPVDESRPPIFCPPLFNGFLYNGPIKCALPPSSGFLARFQGFFRETCPPIVLPMESVWLRCFRGFVRSAEPTNAPSVSVFCSGGFEGFVNDARRCVVSATMAGLNKKETVKR